MEHLSGFNSKVIVDILTILFYVKVHNVYFKTVILLVDVRFISLPKVIKKIKSTSRKAFFYKNCRILKTLPCIEKLGYGFEGRIYLNHFPKQKRKSDVSFRS